jgi:plasmid stabilization system protein ParE
MERLGGEHHVVAASLERLADDLLRFAVAVRVRRVDEVDAEIQRLVDHADAFVVIGIGDLPKHHRAQTVRADPDAGPAERAVLHVRLSAKGGDQ